MGSIARRPLPLAFLLTGCTVQGPGGTIELMPAGVEGQTAAMPGYTPPPHPEKRDEDELIAELSALSGAQEAFRRQRGRYAGSPGELAELEEYDRPSGGIRVRIVEATSGGFSAIAERGSAECAIFTSGVGPPRAYVSAPGRIECRTR